MHFNELQQQLREIEHTLQKLNLEIEDMKPKADSHDDINFDTITRLAYSSPREIELNNSNQHVYKLFIYSLAYMVTKSNDITEKLLYITHLAAGWGLSLSAEEIYVQGLQFSVRDLDVLCYAMKDDKYTYLIEAFITANLLGRAENTLMEFIAEVAQYMNLDKEELMVVMQVAKSILTKNTKYLDTVLEIATSKYVGKYENYISESYLPSKRKLISVINTGMDSISDSQKKYIASFSYETVKKGDVIEIAADLRLPRERRYDIFDNGGISAREEDKYRIDISVEGRLFIGVAKIEWNYSLENAPHNDFVEASTSRPPYNYLLFIYVVPYMDTVDDCEQWFEENKDTIIKQTYGKYAKGN